MNTENRAQRTKNGHTARLYSFQDIDGYIEKDITVRDFADKYNLHSSAIYQMLKRGYGWSQNWSEISREKISSDYMSMREVDELLDALL